jgi:hypothetical protein
MLLPTTDGRMGFANTHTRSIEFRVSFLLNPEPYITRAALLKSA